MIVGPFRAADLVRWQSSFFFSSLALGTKARQKFGPDELIQAAARIMKEIL